MSQLKPLVIEVVGSFMERTFQEQLSRPSDMGPCSESRSQFASFWEQFTYFCADSVYITAHIQHKSVQLCCPASSPSLAALTYFPFNLGRDFIFTVTFGCTNYCLSKRRGGEEGRAHLKLYLLQRAKRHYAFIQMRLQQWACVLYMTCLPQSVFLSLTLTCPNKDSQKLCKNKERFGKGLQLSIKCCKWLKVTVSSNILQLG